MGSPCMSRIFRLARKLQGWLTWKLVCVASGRTIAIFLQLLIVRCYARSLQPHQLGIFYFLSTLSYVINAVILVPIDLCQQPKALNLWVLHKSAWPALKLQGTLFAWGIGIIEVAYRMNLPERGHVAKTIWPKALASI